MKQSDDQSFTKLGELMEVEIWSTITFNLINLMKGYRSCRNHLWVIYKKHFHKKCILAFCRTTTKKITSRNAWNASIMRKSNNLRTRLLTGIYLAYAKNQGRIFFLRRGVSLLTNIFSNSSRGRLEPSGWLTNFQPPPFPRLPRDPSISTVKFQPSEGRLRLYLWHFTFFAI